ncbi:MAG: hypothetical protein WBZ04_06110, partial [Candidatus Nanopelagicales bacterium]
MKPTKRSPHVGPGAEPTGACETPRSEVSRLTRRKRTRVAVVSILSLALVSTAGVVSPAISVTPGFRAAIAPASLKDDVEAAKAKLKEVSRAVDAADKRVDDAEAKLPAANEALAK